ncbi:MAG: oxidoreductase [Chloroflexota bacterium]
MNGWTAKDMPDQSGRVVVITGANSGVGYESAVAFAAKGARVVMASRSMDKLEKARQDLLQRVPKAKVDVMQLDLGSLKSVQSFADSFNANYDRLDILMNNAGIMIPPYGKTSDGFELQFGTNHLGHFALTGWVLPKILATPHSRIATTSSGAYLYGQMHWDDLQFEKEYRPNPAYAQSKLANILFMRELQRKLEAAHADAISVGSQPGYARTNLQNNQPQSFGERVMYAFLRVTMSQSADLGALYQLYSASAPDVKGGDFYEPRWALKGRVVKRNLIAKGRNIEDAARLWEISERLTGVHYAVLGDKEPVLTSVMDKLDNGLDIGLKTRTKYA